MKINKCRICEYNNGDLYRKNNKKKILCENCLEEFDWEELVDASDYELAPVYVCPQCGAYRFKVIKKTNKVIL